MRYCWLGLWILWAGMGWSTPVAAQSGVGASGPSVWQGAHGIAAPLTQFPKGLVYSYDGNDGIPIQPLIGADRFYAAGVYGQGSVTANIEAGLAWKGHAWLPGVTQYVAASAANEVDMHATWVTSVLGAFDPNQDQTDGYPYYKLGMAPLTDLNSTSIATNWYNLPETTNDNSAYFDITPKTFYDGYNHYVAQQTWSHEVNTWFGSISQPGAADVINSSWGYDDPAATDPITRAAAGFACAHPHTTIVFAAGNSTVLPDGDPETIPNTENNVGGPASSFNTISVGAVGDFSATNYTSVATFSSRGPQDYYDPQHGLVKGVRAPVSIVAPGTTLLAAYYGGQTGGNGLGLRDSVPDATTGANEWFSYGLAGTSFAAPIVAGGVALLDSASYLLIWGSDSRDARVIKAVLLNSARKLPGWNNGQHADIAGKIITTQSLDWSQGAGMIDLDRAFDQYLSGTADVAGLGGGAIGPLGWDYGSIAKSADSTPTAHNDYTIQGQLRAGTVLDATLSWFRNVGAPVFTDNADPLLQTLTSADNGFANLDLEIWDSAFTTLFAASMSQYNDVEHLHFLIPEDGGYALRVTYADQMFGTPQEEIYGLAWGVVPEPGSVTLLLVALGAGLIAWRWKT